MKTLLAQHHILTLLDSAKLAVFDLTPTARNPDRANVFYELGLVHLLGIPMPAFNNKIEALPRRAILPT